MRWTLVTVTLLGMTKALWAEAPQVLPPYTKPTLIAHRGASWDAPEHTLNAYALALQQGSDFVEPDLQLTKDGVLVCMHDTTLERTTNAEELFPDRSKTVGDKRTWPVDDFTLAEIKRLDAGAWKGPEFAGAKVPTFQEMIDLVKGKAGIIPETKAPEAYGRRGQSMEQAVMHVLRTNDLDVPGANPKTPVIIQSFSAASLKALRNEHGCKLPLVFLADEKDTTPAGLAAVKQFADGVAPNKADVLAREGMVKDAHDLGMSVTVWTFRPERNGKFKDVRDEMRYFLRTLGVDAVFTDTPDKFPRE